MIIKYINKKNLWKKRDHLKIVTFNYDRLLEFVLLNDCSTLREDVIDWCKNNIIHVYGFAGLIKEPNHYFDEPDSISFGNNTYDLTSLKPFIEKLQTQYDDRIDLGTYNTASDIIANTNNVSIFGFGYDFVNCRYLGLNNHMGGKYIYANINPFDDPGFHYRRELTNRIRTMQPNTVFSYNTCTKFVQDRLRIDWEWNAKF